MKKRIIILILGILLSIYACSDEPLAKEQYKKEVYLIGATDEKITFSLNYNKDTVQEVFVTISTSGTHDISKSFDVEMKIDQSVVDFYNYRYFYDFNAYKKLRVLREENYEIESMSVRVDHTQGIYKRVPIKINTNGLHCDSTYVIPFRLLSTSEYSLAKDSAVILQLKFENDYMGEFLMVGDFNGSETFKSKQLFPVDENQVRMWIQAIDDSNELNIGLHTVVLTIDDKDGSVVITDWDTTQGIYDVSGTGTYDKAAKKFRLNYTYSDDDGVHTCNESLVFVE